MAFKVGLLVFTLFVGCLATEVEQTVWDMSSDTSDVFTHTNDEERIVGGSQAKADSAPYMVALTAGDKVKSLYCGGSLVNTRNVLTAAHCVVALYSEGSLKSSLRAIVGTNTWKDGGNTYKIARNITHSGYDPRSLLNDLGVLITSSAVKLSNTVKVIPLSYDFVDAGVIVKATGWGLTKKKGSISSVLLELFLRTVDGKKCVSQVAEGGRKENFRLPAVNPRMQLCAIHSKGHSMCNGDSGSPLVLKDKCKQVGVVSWGLPCAFGVPDVFVRLSNYESWLRNAIAAK